MSERNLLLDGATVAAGALLIASTLFYGTGAALGTLAVFLKSLVLSVVITFAIILAIGLSNSDKESENV